MMGFLLPAILVGFLALLAVIGIVATRGGADEYKYVPIRRFALFLENSLHRGTKWAVFEPNEPPGGLTENVDPKTLVGFNPQPEPPGLTESKIADPASLVGFNPQPEPPGLSENVDPKTLVGFNPQPEPP